MKNLLTFPCLSKVDPKKIVLTANVLEFFDLYLYIHLAHIINQKFFPYGEPTALRMLPFISFYLLAPLSCILFAFIGDTRGRKPVLITTAFVMAISSFLIVFLPTYETWGVYPGYFLILLRVLQGISLGGEPTAANLYIAELCEDEKKAPVWITLLASMECVGGMLALGLAYIGENYLGHLSWGWRLPFIGGIGFIFFSLIVRLHLIESPEFLKETHNKPISMFDKSRMIEFYQSLRFRNINTISLFIFWSIYPILFVLIYTYFTPMVLEACSLDVNSHIIGHNLCLSALEMMVSLSWIPLVLWGRWSVKQITVIRFLLTLIFCFLFYYTLNNDPNKYLLMMLQALIIGCGDFVLIAPFLFKSFSVIGRFSYMAITRSVAQLINFLVIAFIIDLVNKHLGLMGVLVWIITPLMLLGFIAIYFCVLHYELPSASLRQSLKDAKPADENIVISNYKY